MKQLWKKYKWWLIIGVSILIVLIIVLIVIKARSKKVSKMGDESEDSSNDSSNDISGGKKPKRLLFVGDSVTAILNYANNTPIKYTYPNNLKKDLEPLGYKIDVLAKGAEETKWMLKNLPDKLANNKYDRIYIYGGANDGQNDVPLEKYLSNMEKMIKLGKDSGAEVYVIAGFDNSKTIDPNKVGTTRYVTTKEEMYKRWQRWMDWQQRLPQLIKSADKVIPIIQIPKEFVPDGLHPNAKGAQMLADRIKQTL